MERKKLYRSANDKMLCGVCGGLAEYFNVDTTLVRLAWALIALLSGFFPALLGYALAAVIIPPAIE